MSSEPIRVLLVDDHPMVRSGLAMFLSTFDDLELVGQAQSGAEALRLCEEVHPDVVLMDLVMPDMDGATTIREVRKLNSAIQCIALTSFADTDLVHQALSAGAIGYLLKNTSINELAGAIRSAYNGKPTLAPEAFSSLISTSTVQEEMGSELTVREREILELLAKGYSNPQIAANLVLSRSTIKTHVSSILSKLGVANRVEAVTVALQHKIITQS